MELPSWLAKNRLRESSSVFTKDFRMESYFTIGLKFLRETSMIGAECVSAPQDT